VSLEPASSQEEKLGILGSQTPC